MAPAEDDISIEEKRVYAGSAGHTDVYVATGTGLVRVAVSADKIGEFSMAARVDARDVAVLARPDAPDLLGVATADGLRVAPLDGDDLALSPLGSDTESDSETAPESATEPDPAVALGVHDGAFVVAAEDGRVRGVTPGADASDDAVARDLGEVDDPRAVDGPLVAAADGVYRVVGDGSDARLSHVGLSGVRDVAGAGVPLAATADGLYWLGNGWMDALAGGFDAVAADGEGHALAATDETVHVREGGSEWDADAWEPAPLPVSEAVVALGYGPGVAVAVTDAGTLCVDAGDGWRHQVVGVRDVGGVAAVSSGSE